MGQPAKQELSPQDEAKALLAELEKVGIKKPEQIVGMAQASYQAGKSAELLGASRKEADQLRSRVAELETAMSKRQTEPVYGSDGQTIDLASLIEQKSGNAAEKAVRKVVQEMAENQQKQWHELNSIRADEDYELVKDVWEKYMITPEAQGKLASGETTLSGLYNNTKVTLLKEMLKKSHGVIKGLTNVVEPGKKPVVHVESGEGRGSPLPTGNEEKEEKINKTVEARKTGRVSSDAALESIIKTILPADDPIWKTR
jgi:hypothetical protein